jgi:hypothetical protein
MARKRPFTLVEMDIPVCSLTYGTSPCTASIPTTGAQRCFNTVRSCQDRPNFAETFKTLRICKASEDIPQEYDALPNLLSANVTPGVIDPGNSIGTRANVKVSAAEHPSSDAIFDKYLTTRTYDPFTQGTFWARLRARVPSLQGIPLRVLRGEFGEPLDTYLVEHYIVETAVIDADGISMTAKDALSYCDPKKAQCPVLSNGRAPVALSAADTTLTMTPSGIGDLEYPASGYVCLSNKEICAFTRSHNVLTLTRGQLGTAAIEHDEDCVVQLVQVFESMSAAEITYSLLTDFTPGIDPTWCDLDAWATDADTYVGHLFTAVIPAPTSVKTLLDEMMQQAGCSLWWDPVAQKVRFQTLRPVTPNAYVFDGNRIVDGTFKAKDQPDKRVSESWTYYGLANPTNKVDKESNFRAAVAQLDPTADSDYDIPAFRTNLARWITVDNRPAAERLNAMILARFRDAPRRAGFSMMADAVVLPELGTGILVQDLSLQEVDGSPATVPFYVTSVDNDEAMVHVELEEMHFDEDLVPDGSRAVYIDVDHFNVNLRTLYDAIYSSVPALAVITFTVEPGAYVGGQVLDSPSIDVGTWPADTVVNLYIGTPTDSDAKVLGRGGDGGGYPGPSLNGEAGSTALYTRRALHLFNYGRIGGGGGGGQGRFAADPATGTMYAAGGGGGAGFNGYNTDGTRRGGQAGRGAATTFPTNGSPTAGGVGAVSPLGPGGDGGGLAQDGRDTSNHHNHTAPGVAIDGVSFVTFDAAGVIIGTQIN